MSGFLSLLTEVKLNSCGLVGSFGLTSGTITLSNLVLSKGLALNVEIEELFWSELSDGLG